MVNAYVVWLGLLCDGSCSLSSVDHCVNLFSWIPAFMRSFAITTSHCCLNRQLLSGPAKERTSPSPPACSLLTAAHPFILDFYLTAIYPPEHLLKKQTNTARSYWTHLGLSGSAPGYIWKVIFSSCLSALLYFIPALSKQSTLWFLSPVWADPVYIFCFSMLFALVTS